MGEFMYGVYLDRGPSGGLMYHSTMTLGMQFEKLGMEYPYFSAVVFAKMFQDKVHRHQSVEVKVQELLKGEWCHTCVVGDLYSALVKGCCNPHLKGKMGTRDEIEDALLTFNWDFTDIEVSEIDPLKATGLKKVWLARQTIKTIDDSLCDYVHNRRNYNALGLDGVLTSINREGYDLMLKHYTLYVGRNKKVKAAQILKPAKILQAAFPHISKDIISAAAGFVADELKECLNDILNEYTFFDSSDISTIYTMTHALTGTLGQSCMREEDANFFELYDWYMLNTHILYVTDGYGTLIGRALLHEDVVVQGEENTINIMDRIYYADSDVLAAFKAWARENGYWRKLEQTLGESDYVSPEGKVEYLPYIAVQCKVINKGECDRVPYLDTFAFYCTQDPEVLWSEVDPNIGKASDWHALKESEGFDKEGFFTKQRGEHKCASCNDYIDDPDDVRRGPNYDHDRDDIYCESCFDSLFRTCDICGAVHDIDDSTFIDREDKDVCSDCFKKYYETCDLCGEHVQKNNAKDFYDRYGDEAHVCKDCAREDDRVIRCSRCGELCHEVATETVHVGIRDELWCPSCVKDEATKCCECEEYFPDDDILAGEGRLSDYKYCEDCHFGVFGGDDRVPEPKVLCSCSCIMEIYSWEDGAFVRHKVQKVCMSDELEFQECKKRLAEGDMRAVKSPSELECHCCHEEVANDNSVIDEQGHVYHEECYKEMRKSNPHPCSICKGHVCNVYSLLGEDMCKKCILKTQEGVDRWKTNLFRATLWTY